jgi:hypothetical protein
MFCQALYSKVGELETQKNKMEIQIKIDMSELLDKSKELDLSKILALYQEVQNGKEIKLFNNMVKIQKIEEKKKK